MATTGPVHDSPAPLRALLYLYARSSANRVRAQLRRVRNPRYLAAMVLGAVYLWWALIRNARGTGTPIDALLRADALVLLGGAVLMLSSARWWLFGSERGALAFTPAEVQFLFPAPISRRGLVHAKLLRLQLATLLNTLIISVLVRGRVGDVGAWERALALWVLFTTVSLHRLGAAIVHASAADHGGAGRRRGLLPLLLFSAVIAAVVSGLVSDLPAIRLASLGGVRATVDAVVQALGAPIPAAALWPVKTLLAPLQRIRTDGYGPALAGAGAILLGHYLWVVRLDRAFEEAALEATQHRAERVQRYRASQMARTRTRSGKLARVPRLGLTGRPELAVVWKNIAAALRGGAWRTQLLSFTVGLAVLAVASRAVSASADDTVLGITMGWLAMLLFLGPLWMRVDLRLDLPRLALLKALPLTGWRIVGAEIAAVTVLHTLTVWALMLVPIGMFLQDPALFERSGATGPLLVAVALAVPVVNALMFTIHNGTALLFPAWVRLGSDGRGFETMGQNLLTTGLTTFAAAVALVFPVGVGLLALWFADDWTGWRIIGGTLAGSLVLLLELVPVWRWLGSVFDATDVTDVAAS